MKYPTINDTTGQGIPLRAVAIESHHHQITAHLRLLISNGRAHDMNFFSSLAILAMNANATLEGMPYPNHASHGFYRHDRE